MRFLLGIIIVSTFALVAGCSHADQAAPAPAQSADQPAAQTPVATTPAPAPAAQPREASPRPDASADAKWLPTPTKDRGAPFQTVGIPACDQFAFAVQACLSAMHGTRGERVRGQLERQLTRWKQALDSGTSAADIAEQCSRYSAGIKRDLHSMGCRL